MSSFAKWVMALSLAVVMVAGVAQAATFVYVTNAEDGTIGTYTMADDGKLTPGPRMQAQKLVMPMAVSPDKRFLYAAARTKPFTLYTYAIDPKTGALKEVAKSPLAESFPYISTDKTGKFLLAAGYGGAVISVNAIGKDGKLSAEPLQLFKTAMNPHCIITDKTNRFAYVPHLGSDVVLQFTFNPKTGKLAANTPPLVLMKSKSGPRHLVISNDNRFAYLSNEMIGTVTTLAIDQKTGLLSYVSEASMVPPNSGLKPGAPRLPFGSGEEERDTSKDIWSSDLKLTPDGKFLYSLERTGSTVTGFSVDSATGKLTFLAATKTEKMPRGFAIHPNSKYMVVSGELSDKISVYSIGSNGALSLINQYPTGKDSNWVEIVTF